jgi:hypothetical protein
MEPVPQSLSQLDQILQTVRRYWGFDALRPSILDKAFKGEL